MHEFYLLTREVTYFVTFLFALCILSQTLATMASFYRYPRNRVRITETLLELLILCFVFACSLLHGETREAYMINILVPTGYGKLRIIIFTLIVMLVIGVIVITRKPWPLLAVAAAGFALPICEQLTGNTFAYIFITTILFWMVRGILIGFWRYREIRTSISELSVKHSIDSLNTGVLFCDEDGFIILSNTRMQNLMAAITGKVQRNGRYFHSLLTSGAIDTQCKIMRFEGQNAEPQPNPKGEVPLLIVLPDGLAMKISLSELPAGKKKYMQITATDISAQWKLTEELQHQNETLLQRQDELSMTIANLHTISHEKETQKAKMRAHDILGERLTLLLHTIRDEIPAKAEFSKLRSLSQELMNEIIENNETAPHDGFDILKQTFESIGIKILFEGELPEDGGKEQLVMYVTREAVTNAVRHGLATEVTISAERIEGNFHLKITDNGHGAATDTITEGGGLGGIRKKIEPFGGTLHITSQPRFMLTVDLPGNKEQ